MIRSIFGRNKPINFIIIFVMALSLLLCYQGINYSFSEFRFSSLLGFLLVMITLFLVDYMDRSNYLTDNNSYSIFFFSTTFCFFPYWFEDVRLIFSNILIIAATIRLLSIWRHTAIKQKLFDSSLLILSASLLYNWAILFLLMIWVAIIFYTPKSVKNILIPLVASSVIGIGVYIYFIFSGDETFIQGLFNFKITYHYERYNTIDFWIPVGVITIFSLISSISYLYSQKQRVGKHRIPELLISFFVISLFVSFISDDETTSESIFILTPFCLLTTLFVEKIRRRKLKNAILWLFALLPFILLLLHFITKG